MADLYIEFIEPVGIEDIVVLEGREPLNEQTVAMLMDSIKRIGLIEPIAVRWIEDPTKLDGGLVLVDGLHRLEACRRLGHRAVNVKQLGADELTAAVAEVETNRVRNHADVATQVRRTAKAKDLFERVEAAERQRAADEQVKKEAEVERRRKVEAARSESDSRSFTTVMAHRTGLDPRTLQLQIKANRDITDEAWQRITEHAVLNKARFINACARKPPEEQLAFIDQTLANGGKVVDPDAELKRLRKAWKDAAPLVRSEFVEELLSHVGDIGGLDVTLSNPEEPGLSLAVRNPATGAVIEVPLRASPTKAA